MERRVSFYLHLDGSSSRLLDLYFQWSRSAKMKHQRNPATSERPHGNVAGSVAAVRRLGDVTSLERKTYFDTAEYKSVEERMMELRAMQREASLVTRVVRCKIWLRQEGSYRMTMTWEAPRCAIPPRSSYTVLWHAIKTPGRACSLRRARIDRLSADAGVTYFRRSSKTYIRKTCCNFTILVHSCPHAIVC